jgi:hypothetical protein
MTELEFGLLGRRVTGRVSPGAGNLVRELFQHPEIATALESDWVIEIHQRDEDAPLEAMQDAYRAEIHGGFVMVRTDHDTLWVSGEDHTVRVTVNGTRASLEVYSRELRGGGALMVAMLEALRASGLIPLHAAMADRDGRATAFLGASGRGKTTSLITAMANGYAPVCEDFALLEPDSLQVYGLDRGLRLLPDTLERLRTHYPRVEPESFVRGKHFVPYERIAERLWTSTLTRLWLLERTDADTRLEPLGASERVMALFTASGVPLLETGREITRRHFARLPGELEMARLRLGTTPIPLE